jgi:hypothetical protein
MQAVRLAFSLARLKAGNNIAARIAMIAMTTSSSINVKAVATSLPLLQLWPENFIALV